MSVNVIEDCRAIVIECDAFIEKSEAGINAGLAFMRANPDKPPVDIEIDRVVLHRAKILREAAIQLATSIKPE